MVDYWYTRSPVCEEEIEQIVLERGAGSSGNKLAASLGTLAVVAAIGFLKPVSDYLTQQNQEPTQSPAQMFLAENGTAEFQEVFCANPRAYSSQWVKTKCDELVPPTIAMQNYEFSNSPHYLNNVSFPEP